MSPGASTLVLVLLVAAMVAMGTATTVDELRARLRHPAGLVVVLGVNLVLLPAVVVAIVPSVLPEAGSAAVALVLVAAAPGGGTGALLAFHARGDVAHAVTLQVLLAAGSLVAAPVWIAYYASSSPDLRLDTAPLVVTLLAGQLLPLVAGLRLRAVRPELAAVVHRRARLLADVCLGVLIVVLVISSGPDLGRIDTATYAAVAALLALTVVAGLVVPGAPPTRRAATMTTLVRNLSLALAAARFTPDPEATALTILTYGLGMYLLALALVTALRRRQPA